MKNKFFIAVYTNEVKDYCDADFFSNLYSISRGEQVIIIDNTILPFYSNKLRDHFTENGYDNFLIHHLPVPEHPKESQFQRNVCYSVNALRDIYLNEFELPYFLIIESDVIPPPDLLDKFEDAINQLNFMDPNWGIIGALYYPGFHNYGFDTTLTFFEKTNHCLSGCTIYKRELIEKYNFRFDPDNLGPFPDAFISYDAGAAYSLWNDHRIKCEHLHINGVRISKNL